MKWQILIVENQLYQYEMIKKNLKGANVSVFPTDEDYKIFTDWVRVYTSKRYTDQKMQACFNKIIRYIKENDILLVLMDYKLAANHDGGNGLQLASALFNEFSYLRFIFLSQTLENDIDVRNELISIAPYLSGKYSWAYKRLCRVRLICRFIFPIAC